jgi:hypothetical protein
MALARVIERRRGRQTYGTLFQTVAFLYGMENLVVLDEVAFSLYLKDT